eukprot:CAMPEP_0183509444 /NCGR_PEP_ID=MMETSP0371-20130417/9609_1 /TAXON_ID=268820 /ORGANISM="Peridinium aciculiferum, Strain PAER-2" /LENGTH=48 /DNA_ID= /DNA_START= /DNA_END= /DNA_ORIENTATION=
MCAERQTAIVPTERCNANQDETAMVHKYMQATIVPNGKRPSCHGIEST